jgi:hypothetical protein
MFKKLILILSFCSLAAHADKKTTCLKVNQQQNKLTFFYSKEGGKDQPYYYAKVQDDKAPASKNMTWHDIRGMTEHLQGLSNTEPKQYLIPGNAKHLYIVKSLEPLDFLKGFGISSRIVPTANSRKKPSITKRNAGNFIRTLPEETKKQSFEHIENAVNICEYRF